MTSDSHERRESPAGGTDERASGEAVPGAAVAIERVIAALRKVHDPEIPVNIYDLGLVYAIDLQDGVARIRMTLTAPNCPVADRIVADVASAVRGVEDVADAEVTLVFDPPWTTAKLTDVGRLELLAMGVDPDRAKESFVGRPTGITIGGRRRP